MRKRSIRRIDLLRPQLSVVRGHEKISFVRTVRAPETIIANV
jgi:hypothetical protein